MGYRRIIDFVPTEQDRPYTPEEDALLRDMILVKKYSRIKIGKLLGRTPFSVNGRWHRINKQPKRQGAEAAAGRAGGRARAWSFLQTEFDEGRPKPWHPLKDPKPVKYQRQLKQGNQRP